MGNDNELGLCAHATQVAGESGHIDVIQGGLDLVHHAKGGGAHLQNGKVEGNGHEGLLTAGEEGENLEGLARRLDLDLNTAAQDVLRVLQLQGGHAAAEELGKSLPKGGVDHTKLLGKNRPHLPGDLGDDLLQLLLGPLDVIPLVGEIGIPLVDPVKLLDGVQVDVAQAGDAPLELPHPLLGLGHALQLLALGPGRLMGELIGLPKLVQNLLFLHRGGHFLLLQQGDLPLQV